VGSSSYFIDLSIFERSLEPGAFSRDFGVAYRLTSADTAGKLLQRPRSAG
jgi:hypothetical protein